MVAAGVSFNSAWGSGDWVYVIGIPGTSFSAPSVAGLVNLLAEYYQQFHPNAPELLASTLKGLVIHTADQCGGALGPSYRFGYGLVNTAQAATLIQQDATNGLKNQIKEVMLNSGQYVQFPVVSPGGANNPLNVTICWTDPPGSGNAETNLNNPAIKLVNDLDLRVIAPDGTTNFPYLLNPDLTNQSPTVWASAATTGDDNRSNVEQVYVANPTNGTYIVTVIHKGTLTNSQWGSITSLAAYTTSACASSLAAPTTLAGWQLTAFNTPLPAKFSAGLTKPARTRRLRQAQCPNQAALLYYLFPARPFGF